MTVQRRGYIGQSLPRVEDDRLLRGAGKFADDIFPPATWEVAFLRSPHAHARIMDVDTAEASSMPGLSPCTTQAM